MSMTRKDILDLMPEVLDNELENDLQCWMIGVLDHFEERIKEIDSKLDVKDVRDLDEIKFAKYMSRKLVDDLC